MAAKKKQRGLHPINTLDLRQPTVDSGEMGFAFGVFQAGFRLKMPMESPATKGIRVESAEEAKWVLEPLPLEVQNMFIVREDRISPKDTPFHRAVFGVATHYKDHPQREAILTRLSAFYFLVNDCYGTNRWQKWQKDSQEDPEAKLLHPAVIEAIASVPLSRYGGFEIEDFFSTVERIAQEKYSK